MPQREPPDFLEHPAVVLKQARQSHLEGLHAAIVFSQAELREFIDWAGGEVPPKRSTTQDFLANCQDSWLNLEAFNYVITAPQSGEIIGSCALMGRQGPGRLEIGYWVRSDCVEMGVATAATTLLTRAAFGLRDISVVQIHHDAANIASGRIPRKLNFIEAVRRNVEINNPGEVGIEVIWEITKRAWLKRDSEVDDVGRSSLPQASSTRNWIVDP